MVQTPENPFLQTKKFRLVKLGPAFLVYPTNFAII